MADEELRRRETDQKLYVWKEKMRMAREFINNVGIPSILILGFSGLMGATWLGYLEPPWRDGTNAEHQHIQQELRIAVETMTHSHEAQTQVLQQAVAVLKEMRCDLKPTNEARIRCFRNVVNGHRPEE